MKHIHPMCIAVVGFIAAGFISAQTSWTPVSSGSGEDLRFVRFFDESSGWIKGDNGTMLMTADSGKTWNTIPNAAPYYLDQAVFVNPSTGYGLTSYWWGPMAGTALFFRTYDAGESWDIETLDLEFSWMGPMSFFDAGHGWMFVNNGPFVGPVMITRDSARTWNEYAFNIPSVASTDGSGIHDVLFCSPILGWACGERKSTIGGHPSWKDGIICRTIDGGEHWTIVAIDNAYLRKITALNEMYAWVLARPFSGTFDYTVIRTTDGGTVWEELHGTPLLNSLWFADADSGWAVSDHCIYKTLDGGHTWAITHTDEAATYHHIHFSGATGGIVGDGGLFLRYTPPNSVESGLFSEQPSVITLLQNYPNPFNSETVIEFTLDHRKETTVRVFDQMGRRVRLLDVGMRDAGTHRLVWEAAEEPSGVYLIAVRAGTNVKTIKCLLLR